MTKEEKEKLHEERKIENAKKVARHRGWKNFGWWFFGFLSSIVVVGGAAAVAVAVIPAGTYFNNNSEYMDEETQKKTLLQILMNYQDISLSNFPAINKLLQKALESAGLDSYIKIDYDKLSEMKLKDFDPQYLLDNCIEIIATIDSTGMQSYLGEFANLSIMTDWTPLKEDEVPDPSKEGFEAYLYYYQNENGEYVRAYNDDKTLVEGASGKQLYYPALRKIPVDELANCIPTRVGQAGVTELLSLFTDFDSNSLVLKIFDGYQIKDMGSFDANEILLNDVLEHSDDNDSLYKILCAAVNVEDGKEQPTWQTITIGHLNNIDINKVKLVDVIEPTTDNEQIYSVLRDAVGVDSNDKLTIGNISSANLDNVKISVLLPYDGNETLYKVLGAKNKEEAEKKTISSLSVFDINTVYLNDVTDLSSDLVDILLKGIEDDSKTKETITIGDLNTFSIDRVPLSLIIEDNEENKKLVTILKEATGVTDYSELTLNSLNGGNFDINKVKLTSVISGNDVLFDILRDATGVTSNDDLTIGSLSGEFDINKIKLKTIFGEESTGNVLLDSILEGDDVTVGNLPDKINNLTLYEAYGEQCFTTDSTNSWIPADHYTKQEITITKADGTVTTEYAYYYDETGEGEYYVSKNSGFMLLLSYKAQETDLTNGRTKIYYPSNYTLKDFEGNSESSEGEDMNKVVANAYIYELIAAGIIADNEDKPYNNTIKAMTVQQLINFAAQYNEMLG